MPLGKSRWGGGERGESLAGGVFNHSSAPPPSHAPSQGGREPVHLCISVASCRLEVGSLLIWTAQGPSLLFWFWWDRVAGQAHPPRLSLLPAAVPSSPAQGTTVEGNKILFQGCGYRERRRRQWQSTPVLLPGKFYERRSLVCCNSWGCKESDTTERPARAAELQLCAQAR